MAGWEMIHNRRVIFGEGKSAEIPGLFKWYGKKKVFFSVYSKEESTEGKEPCTKRFSRKGEH